MGDSPPSSSAFSDTIYPRRVIRPFYQKLVLPLIFGVVSVLGGLIGLIGGEVFMGIITIVVGGFIAYWCFIFVGGTIGIAETRKDEQKRATADYDALPARIAERKRQLAQLEAKFR